MKDKKRPHRLGSLMSRSVTAVNIDSLLTEAKVIRSWPLCVGEGIARNAGARRLIGGTLHVDVSSATWMTELTYQKRTIIDRLNREAGGEVVKEIVFKAGKVAAPPRPEAPTGPTRAEEETAIYKAVSPERRRFIDETVGNVTDPELASIIRRILERPEPEE